MNNQWAKKKKKWDDIFKILKQKTVNQGFYIQQNYSSKLKDQFSSLQPEELHNLFLVKIIERNNKKFKKVKKDNNKFNKTPKIRKTENH